MSLSVEGKSSNMKKQMARGNRGVERTDSWIDDRSLEADALDFASMDTLDNTERHCSTSGQRDVTVR